MPRRSRLMLPGVPMHLIQRGNNRQACFFTADDYTSYLRWLAEGVEQFGCRVHVWVLMINHAHLLVSADTQDAVAKLMKCVGQRYTQYVNRVYGRTGSLWEGRFRSCLTDSDAYVLTCMRYIELNPVRARMVDHPGDYAWSSYRANAYGERSMLVSPHAAYLALATDKALACRCLFEGLLSPELVNELRDATNGNRVFGSSRFAEQVEAPWGAGQCAACRGGRHDPEVQNRGQTMFHE